MAALFLPGGNIGAFAAAFPTEQFVEVCASSRYANWDGVSNVAQFKGPDGNLWYAVDADDAVTVYKTKKGAPVAGAVKLKKPHPLFGTVICDDAGYLYLVTGEANETDNTDKETVFISKFDGKGNHIKTVGDNGGSSLAGYRHGSFCTKRPFSSGNCAAAVFGTTLTVHYARQMYNGHQSNSVFTVNTADMSKVYVGPFYQSHSFAQRVVPTKDGFVYMSEGDCYDRAFCFYRVALSDGALTYRQTENIFDFWVEDGAFDAYDMYVVNNNFAHMGGLAALSDGKIAFAAQSAKSLSSAAASESEEIFIQIFDPDAALDTPAAYVTSGKRTGLAGNNGRTEVTNYGVKWLTAYGKDASIGNVQIVATDKDKLVVLYELYGLNSYEGVWYMVLDEKGNVIRPATRFAAYARLNPCVAPVFADGAVCWVGNRYADPADRLYIYRLSAEEENCSVTNNHTWDAGWVTKEATCGAEGEKTYTCAVCGAEKTELLPKTDDHRWNAGTVTAEPTADAAGEKILTCTVCGATKTVSIPKTSFPGTEERMRGDVDGDGSVTPADARLALRASVRLEIYGEGTPAAIAADYDADGAITSADARLILRRSVGLT